MNVNVKNKKEQQGCIKHLATTVIEASELGDVAILTEWRYIFVAPYFV